MKTFLISLATLLALAATPAMAYQTKHNVISAGKHHSYKQHSTVNAHKGFYGHGYNSHRKFSHKKLKNTRHHKSYAAKRSYYGNSKRIFHRNAYRSHRSNHSSITLNGPGYHINF